MRYYSRRLEKDDLDVLQELLEKCHDYYELIYNSRPALNEAQLLCSEIPTGKTEDDKFVIGIFAPSQELIGVVDFLRDYPEDKTWCLGLFLLCPQERNGGLGKQVYDDLEIWATDLGARIIRLGVAEQNVKAYKFWTKMGFTEIERIDMSLGQQVKKVAVMIRRPFCEITL